MSWNLWSSVSEGRAAIGSSVTAVAIGGGRFALFLADPLGGVFTNSGNAEQGWVGWSSVSQGQAAIGSSVTAVAIGGGRFALFLADPSGGVFTNSGNAEQGWVGWSSVSQGQAAIGSSVTAVAIGGGRFALFAVDPSGGVFTTSGNAEQGWVGWSSVSQGQAAIGSSVTAVAIGGGRFALFAVDPSGGVFTTSGNAEQGWVGWSSVSQGQAAIGSSVTAVAIGGGRFALFAVDPSGGVFTTSGNAEQGWVGWSSVSQGQAAIGSSVTAVAIGGGRFALFAVDPSGGVFTTSGNAERGWDSWSSVSQGRAAPGSSVTVVPIGRDRFALFLADPDGGVFTTSGNAKRILKKTIPLDLLQRKLDEFFNNPERRPLFQIIFDNEGSGDHRHSTLDVKFDHPAKGYTSLFKDDLGQLEVDLPPPFPDPDFHFADFKSDGLTVNIIPGQPVGIEVLIHFEPEGEEMIVNAFPDIDFRGFRIKVRLNLEIDSDNGKVDLKTGASLIRTDANVDVGAGLPDGVFASGVESVMNTKIADALGAKKQRDYLNPLVTRWLVGGDFTVIGVEGNDRELSIDYILPPGQLEPFPETAQPPLDRGLLANIEHIVVLMMENRSFDHMLGYLSKQGERGDVDGLRGGEKNHYKGRDYPSFPLTGTVFLESPCHGHACVVNQINGGKLDGFVADFANHYEADGVEPGKVMGHYTAAQVPVYNFLAQEFLICQRWFAAHPGPTFPNRFYTLTGRLNRDANGRFQFDNPHGGDFTPVFTRTIFDHLTDHAVPWHYYEHGYGFLRMFERYTSDDEYIVDARDPVKGFFASARAGTLPAVSFVDPDFIDVPPGDDDGPPADIAYGQRLVAEIVKAVIEGPNWNKTLLVITYDEHGGFFDHVAPPAAIPVSAINEYGARVPTFVISPWVERRKVSDITFDHTSIAKTIARCFMSANPPDMGERVAGADDLSKVLSSTRRDDKPITPVPPVPPAPSPAVALRAQLERQDDMDYKGILHSLRSGPPVPRRMGERIGSLG